MAKIMRNTIQTIYSSIYIGLILIIQLCESSHDDSTDVRVNFNSNGWKTSFSIPNRSQQKYDVDQIIFPDDQPSYVPQRLTSPICEDEVICENVPNYPIDVIEKQLTDDKYLNFFQSRDEVVEVINRIGGSDDETLCLSTEEVKYPRMGLTRDKKRMYVVNSENFIQAVRVEICRNENGPCRLINGFASGYKTMCEQKYIYRQLLGIQKNGSLAPEYFKIPSSCCCHVKFIGNSWERMGRG